MERIEMIVIDRLNLYLCLISAEFFHSNVSSSVLDLETWKP